MASAEKSGATSMPSGNRGKARTSASGIEPTACRFSLSQSAQIGLAKRRSGKRWRSGASAMVNSGRKTSTACPRRATSRSSRSSATRRRSPRRYPTKFICLRSLTPTTSTTTTWAASLQEAAILARSFGRPSSARRSTPAPTMPTEAHCTAPPPARSERRAATARGSAAGRGAKPACPPTPHTRESPRKSTSVRGRRLPASAAAAAPTAGAARPCWPTARRIAAAARVAIVENRDLALEELRLCSRPSVGPPHGETLPACCVRHSSNSWWTWPADTAVPKTVAPAAPRRHQRPVARATTV
mmetsp:Transcript_57684/g.159557  ORF Transcript_57684/g.159557 Transcript_57684/m.159557 type:complete len:300 (-) Transcript_57684:57-956(-)